VLFDLDETLVVDEDSATAAFLATCELARARHGTDPAALHQAVRQRAGELWRASPTINYCRALGISSWEGLWSAFPGETPELDRLRAWAPTYRREAWARALADCGIVEPTLAQALAATFLLHERPARHAVYPDAAPTLRALRRTHRLGLVTNGLTDLQRAKLGAGGLGAYFDVVVVSAEVGMGKPDPRIFAYALAALGADPGDAAMVGDSLERDVAGAQAAGMRGIWLNRSRRPCPAGAFPDAEVGTLTDLLALLD
jgi:putative hydrolase of the HAD superfamily